MKQQEMVRPITLSISRDLWERFKELVPRSKKLNDAVVELIEQRVALFGIEDMATQEEPFMAEDKGQYLVLYAGGAKCQEFAEKEEAEAFLKQVKTQRRTRLRNYRPSG